MTNLAKILSVSVALPLALVACRDAGVEEATAVERESLSAEFPATVSVTSPDGQNVMTISQENGLRYTMRHKDKPTINSSRLGLRFDRFAGFDEKMQIVDVAEASHDESWEQPWGEQRLIRDHHNELAVTVEREDNGAEMVIRARCFDDGCAFRYEVPEQAAMSGDVAIIDEITQFNLDPQSMSWTIPAREWNRYEYLYERKRAEELKMVHTPATFRTPNGVRVAVHEAALVDYSGMSLERARGGDFEANLAPRADGAKVRTSLPFETPWRTVQMASRDMDLLDDYMILNLNEPNALPDFEFEPGKYAGIWWEQHIREGTWGNTNGEINHHAATTEATMAKMDFAAENGFVGVLVEGWNVGWDGDWFNNGDVFSFTETYPDFDIEAVAEYGRKVGTRLIGHHETSGNITNYENQLEAGLDLLAANDVRVIKSGYVADGGDLKWIDEDGIARYEFHDGQVAVEHHLKVVREAAKRGIAMNPHEPVKDTGLRRTYPNWVSREGARGQEFNAWGVPPNGPDHVPNLIFTRMLSGPMDYTAGAFDLRPSERTAVADDLSRNDPASRIEHTLAKELALFVVIYSPIQMVMDLEENYAARPDAFQFIKDVPTDWETTVPLAGAIGDYAVIARQERGGEDWYLGAVTDGRARDVDVDLSFLDEGTYEAQIYRDGPDADYDSNPYDLVTETREVSAGDDFEIKMGRSGGMAVRFRKL
jgi:alpha-glucosidase